MVHDDLQQRHETVERRRFPLRAGPFLAEHPQLAQLRQYYAALKPADAELKLLHELQQNYAAEFGNSSGPAHDPATEARRRGAVRDLYDLLGSLLGYERFNEYLRETVAQSQPKP